MGLSNWKLCGRMLSDKLVSLFAIIALLQHISPVHPFVTRSASICKNSGNALSQHRRTSMPLYAEKSDEDDDELSSNFLNFLKKNKEEEEDEEEEEEVENVVEAKVKTNIFKELTSG